MASSDWVAINIDTESNDIVKQIQDISHSPFKGATSIQILMSAAALTLNKDLKPSKEFSRGTDITNKNLITEEQKWFMCMLSYSVDTEHALSKLEDRTQIVRTFEQYAQTGLSQLLEICQDRNSRDAVIRLVEEPLGKMRQQPSHI